MVDDASHATHHPIVLIRQEILRLTKFEGSITILPQGVQFVTVQVRRVKLIVLVQVVVKLDKSIQFLPVGDFPNFN
jgi:hypothetical protein